MESSLHQKQIRRAAMRRALRQGFGGASMALASSFIALGALWGDAGLALWESTFCTFIVFALPGQLAAAELYAQQAGLIIIVLSVLLVNMRLMPMTIALLPLLRPPSKRSWRDYGIAYLIAATSWVIFMSTHQQVPENERWLYFKYTGLILWVNGIIATALGWLIGGTLPAWLLLGLLFLNPIYFLCMMMRALARKADAASMIFGMLLLPFMHTIDGELDIMASGVIGGVAAFVLFARRHSDGKEEQ